MSAREPALTHQPRRENFRPGPPAKATCSRRMLERVLLRDSHFSSQGTRERRQVGKNPGAPVSLYGAARRWRHVIRKVLLPSWLVLPRRPRRAGRPRAGPSPSSGQKRLAAFISGCIGGKLHFEEEDCLLFKRGSLTGDCPVSRR